MAPEPLVNHLMFLWFQCKEELQRSFRLPTHPVFMVLHWFFVSVQMLQRTSSGPLSSLLRCDRVNMQLRSSVKRLITQGALTLDINIPVICDAALAEVVARWFGE